MRAARRAAVALALVAAAAAGQGCAASRALGRAMGALTSSPEKVDKEHHPVRPGARLAVTWVGHATAVVQIDDKVIVTDPVFTKTVGEMSKRLVERGVDPEDLPAIDAVLISHMHYDHLSLGSLEMIRDKVRTLLMPPAGTTYLTDFAFPVVELRTWQSWEKDGLRVTAVPVDHVGYRYGVDAAWMTRSFTGYVVQYHDVTVYFPGDTAYDQKDFVETAEHFPNIDLALLPIAPINPPELMHRYHMDPAQAVRAFADLGAKWMVPIHFGTFVDSTDRPGEALERLRAAEAKWNLGDQKIVVLRQGERHVFIETPKEEPKKDEPPVDDDEDMDEEPSPPKATTPDDGDGDDAAADEAPAETKPADKKPAEKKPAEKKPADEKPVDEKPTGKKPAGKKPVPPPPPTSTIPDDQRLD